MVNTMSVLPFQSAIWLIFKRDVNVVFRFSPFLLKCSWCVLAISPRNISSFFYHFVATPFYTVSQKVSPLMFDNNFGKCGPIF